MTHCSRAAVCGETCVYSPRVSETVNLPVPAWPGCLTVCSPAQVVTKFIRKDKVHADHWVDDPTLGRRVPLEVSLLSMLHHPNIVSDRLGPAGHLTRR